MGDKSYQCLNDFNEIKAIFEVLNLKLEDLPKHLHDDLRKCVNKIITSGVTKVDLLACTEKILENQSEILFSLDLKLINSKLKQLHSRSNLLSKQYKNIIEHNKKFGKITSADTTVSETSSGYYSVSSLNSSENDNEYPHKNVLLLKKEINDKKLILKELQKYIEQFEELPPDIVASKKLLSEAKEELEMLNSELLQNSFLNTSSFLNSSSASSYSP